MKRILLAMLFAAAALTTAAPKAEACSCMPPDLVRSYRTHSDVFQGDVLWTWTWGQTRFHLARVRHVFEGCVEPRELVLLTTPQSSAACGIELRTRRTYLITAQDAGTMYGLPRLAISVCGFNVPWRSLTKDQLAFLWGRTVCCGDDCACADGSAPVLCFVDPCEVASCPEGTCEANYCGGCFAEFYTDADLRVCNLCRSDEDCSWGQHCSDDGECRTTCELDEDCPDDQWCRPSEGGGAQCVPYAQEGESCGGYTPIWWAQRCAPELVCTDYPPNVVDLPGICRRPCRGDRDCARDQYCAIDGVCRDDGACGWDYDCMLPGNSYLRPACVGYGECDEGGCGWTCGNPSCVDLAGVELGPCAMFLGWGVVDGRCTALSGCGLEGHRFFATQRDCVRACQRLTAVAVPVSAAARP